MQSALQILFLRRCDPEPHRGLFRDNDPGYMSGMISRVRQALNPGDHVVFALQGGKPTLAGLGYYLRFTDIVRNWDGRHMELVLHYLKKLDGCLTAGVIVHAGRV